MLMKKAPLFIARNCSVPNIPCVSGVSGTVTITKSARGRTSSRTSGRCSSDNPFVGSSSLGSTPQHRHPELGAQPRRFATNAAHAHNYGSGFGQIGGRVTLLPDAGHLLGNVHLQTPREGQQQRHDVRADVVVVYFPRVGYHHVAVNQRPVVIAGPWPRLGAGNPSEIVCPLQQLWHDVAKGSVGLTNHFHRFPYRETYLHVDVGYFFPQQFRPMLW